MTPQLDRIEAKIDGHTERLAAIEADLKYHIRRTDLAEKRIDLVELRLSLKNIILGGGAIAAAVLAIAKLWELLATHF